ncbi:MAG TPA: tyrosine--tRNA ligase, partial [Thermomicrobiales bacterium]|nr:tyrosine--tRNA ligase [Thermomicrobiales bacterium]
RRPTVSMTAALNAPALDRELGKSPLDYLRRRGYVQDVSDPDGLRAAFAAGPVTAYIGFDPTAPSLHVGNLLGIMMLAVLQRFGHRPIALAGGGTALVGDPSGKTSARALASEEAIRANLPRIQAQFAQYLDFAGDRFGHNPPALLLNNADWLLALRYIPFLRDIGRHFSVNEMLTAETYRTRLETTGLNFVEFNYRLVQAYDFLHLFRSEGCTLQMGGSDQWGNIVAGVELIRKADEGKAYALVSPLLTTASGQKMGKSEGNSVWLDPTMTSPFDFYQYWINVDDLDVERLLRLYTFVPDARIDELTSVEGAALREAKRVLAFEVTALTHGRAAAEQADAAARALFGAAPTTADETIPTTEISRADFAAGLTLADLFVRAGLCASRGDARRQAAQGGLSIDDVRVADIDLPFQAAADAVLLRRGKKNYRRVRVV